MCVCVCLDSLNYLMFAYTRHTKYNESINMRVQLQKHAEFTGHLSYPGMFLFC